MCIRIKANVVNMWPLFPTNKFLTAITRLSSKFVKWLVCLFAVRFDSTIQYI